MKALRKAEDIYNCILNAMVWIACSVTAAILLLIVVHVTMRYTLHVAMVWTVQLSEFALVIILSFGMAWLLRDEGHVKVDFLVARLKPRVQALVNGVTSAISAAALLILTWYGGKIGYYYFQEGVVEAGVEFHKGIMIMVLVIGCFFFSIAFLRRAYSNLRTWSSKEVVKQK